MLTLMSGAVQVASVADPGFLVGLSGATLSGAERSVARAIVRVEVRTICRNAAFARSANWGIHCHLASITVTSLLSELAVTMSTFPSLFKSPTTRPHGPPPTFNEEACVKRP